MPIYMHGYCDECGEQGDCSSPFCQIVRMSDPKIDYPDQFDDDDRYFVDDVGVVHGPFFDVAATRAAANLYLYSIGIVGLSEAERPPARLAISDMVDITISRVT